MDVRWKSTDQESPRFGLLTAGAVVTVDDAVGAQWIADGVADAVNSGAPKRRAAAPEPAPEA
jgi:hypothetical protein